MTRSNPRAQEVALSAAFSKAVDLSALKRPVAPAPSGGAPTAAPPGDDFPAVDVTEASFAVDVVDTSMRVLVLVDLWAEWCQPCKQLTPILEKVVAEFGGAVVLARVDVDANPRISQAFGVQSLPTVVAVAAGQPVDAFSGAQPETQIRSWVQGLVEALQDKLPGMAAASTAGVEAPAEPDPLLLAAEAAVEAGDLDAAIEAYQQLAAADPADVDAVLAVKQLQFQQRAMNLPADAVEHARAAPDDVPVQLAASDLLFAAGRVEEAFDLLVALVGRLPAADRSVPRDHLMSCSHCSGTMTQR